MDILQKTHEGTVAVKQSKFQRVTTAFEMVRMEDNETFDDFYAMLSAIGNSTLNLAEVIPKNRVVCMILRSLPERFHLKVVAIEETNDLDILKVDQLVGILQTLKANHYPNTEPEVMALKTYAEIQENPHESLVSDPEETDLQGAAFIVKNYKLLLKAKRAGLKNNFRNNKSSFKSYTLAKPEKNSAKSNS